jgi:hypothetical protein
VAGIKRKLLRDRFVQKLLAPFGQEPTPKKWLFVIGCYNSGTTLLSDILSEHPAISALPIEGVVLTDALPRPEKFGWNRMWSECVEGVRMLPGEGMEKIAKRIKRQWSYSFDDAEILYEKSIANAARIPFLDAYFQPAYFVVIVRNGYAVAEGLRRRGNPRKYGHTEFGDKYPIEMCAKQWVVSDEIVSADAAIAKQVLFLTYEDFCADPGNNLRAITDFLEIEPLPDEITNKSWEVHGNSSKIRNMNEEGIARLSADEIETIREVAGSVLDKYGYLPG